MGGRAGTRQPPRSLRLHLATHAALTPTAPHILYLHPRSVRARAKGRLDRCSCPAPTHIRPTLASFLCAACGRAPRAA